MCVEKGLVEGGREIMCVEKGRGDCVWRRDWWRREEEIMCVDKGLVEEGRGDYVCGEVIGGGGKRRLCVWRRDWWRGEEEESVCGEGFGEVGKRRRVCVEKGLMEEGRGGPCGRRQFQSGLLYNAVEPCTVTSGSHKSKRWF